MAILFFDGFDRCTVTKDLDVNYWSFQPLQPVEYEKYAFGGYSYDHTETGYGGRHYMVYSPNNGILPTADYGPNGYGEDNTYPAFGTPLGFLALSNLDISDTSMLAPITYLQLSGFALPQSGESFLNARIHGIETKDTNYHTSDKAGRFEAKHPLVAFCSGNVTGLILNIVKTTGNHLDTIENTKMTIGLEVEQLAGVSGTLDLNIGNDLQDYRIRSLFSPGGAYYHSGTVQASELSDIGGRILMPTTNKNTTTVPQTRWCHFQFGIIQTGTTPYIQVKLDNVDLLKIPADDTITDKDLWSDRISISGFNYNNVRFFNRTYNGSIPIAYTTSHSSFGNVTYSNRIHDSKSQYYMWGANTLIDDLILNDGSGHANSFLGSNAKVIPFTPGLTNEYGYDEVADDGLVPDPYREWTTNASSHRIALKNLDGDTGKISSSTLGKRTAVPFGSGNIPGIQANDGWRFKVEDAIGGMKIYTQAKKEFLDSAFIPIMKTGQIDKVYSPKTEILIRPEDGITDATEQETIGRFNQTNGSVELTDIKPFSNSGILFKDAYLSVPFIESPSEIANTYNQSALHPSNLVNNENDRFSIESWVYFTGGSKPIHLYTTLPPTGFNYGNPTRSMGYEIFCDREGITYNMVMSGVNLDTDAAQSVKLLFDQTVPTGQWHHIALLQDGIVQDGTYAYPLKAFLNGVQGNKYVIDRPHNQGYDSSLQAQYGFRYDMFPTSETSGNILDDTYPSGNFNIDKNMLLNLVTTSGTLTGSGTLNNPATGIFTFAYTPTEHPMITFTADDTGFMVLHMNSTDPFYNYSEFEIDVNNVKQFTHGILAMDEMDSPVQDSNTTSRHDHQYAQVFVNSGDNITIRHDENQTTPHTTESKFFVQYLYIASPTGIGTFYHYNSAGSRNYAFSKYLAKHKTGGNNFNVESGFEIFGTAFIGGDHIISNYRLTQGSASDNGIMKNRYRDNFNVPTADFLSDRDSYIDLGSNISLTKTRYGRVNEFFLYENPGDQKPWTTGLVADPSGLIMGVRKT